MRKEKRKKRHWDEKRKGKEKKMKNAVTSYLLATCLLILRTPELMYDEDVVGIRLVVHVIHLAAPKVVVSEPPVKSLK